MGFEGILGEIRGLLALHEDDHPDIRRAMRLADRLVGGIDMLNARIAGDPELEAFYARWEKAAQEPDYEHREQALRANWALIMSRRGCPCFNREMELGSWDIWLSEWEQWKATGKESDGASVSHAEGNQTETMDLDGLTI